MAKQLNLLVTGQVIPTELHAEMQRSYLEYAMSVIVGRALPDVRDGLKPVHRRIVYAMHELGLTPDRPYRKCARVVGDVLGKYHPHGDQSVYDALVRMVQDFSSRYPLLAGHGNFGSVDNDPPAAMRYTETRLASISNEALLSDIGEATVDFIGNFDNSQQEPTVLPAQLPVLLLNGCSGIAVGMATNIPPHNLGEVVDGLIALIDRPDLPDEKLLDLVPGPDFPTGGEIVGSEGIREAYATGKGGITVRGVAKIETPPSPPLTRGGNRGGQGRRGRLAIVVTELPFQVNKASWIEKVAELVNQGRIEGIADLRDESDREGMRVVIELRRDVQPQDVLDQLYRQTALSTNFGAILLALVDGQPRQLTLRQILEQFLNFRELTLTRQYSYELERSQERIHLVEGLLRALTQLDAVIEILRNAPDGSGAKLTLQERFHFSERQADAILSMPLRRLTGLERQNLQAEFDQLSQRIELLQQLLGDRRELLKALKKDLRTLKRKYGDPRRTRIGGLETAKEQLTTSVVNPQSPIPNSQSPRPQPSEEEAVLEFTHRGYVRRLAKTGSHTQKSKSQNSLAKQRASGSGAALQELALSNNDFVVNTQVVSTEQDLVALTTSGKAYPIKVRDIPPTSGGSKGTPLVQLMPSAAQAETVATYFSLSQNLENTDLIVLTQQGRIKRLPLLELANLTGRGLTLCKLKDNDQLKYANLSRVGQQLVLATAGGRLLRFEVNDERLPIMGRTSQGLTALRMGRKEHLVDCACLNADDSILLVTELGYAKRLPVNATRPINLGDIGTQVLQFTTKTDALAGMVPATDASKVILLTSAQRAIHLQMDAVKFWGKDGSGDRVVQLNPEEKIISLHTYG